ncbi:MAG: nucleotidyl transferase AbiEii/AbiGii toxin family protein [Bacteroidales bacterium]|nr:nucleotidyl transferase AbiEii/AbiGii toxin family protein [Bacteroidales bacterium]
MTLKALGSTEAAPLLLFKGGTSLSKGWGLIDRFSEDIDLAIKREGKFEISSTSKSQRERLRKISRKYIVEVMAQELDSNLSNLGMANYSVEAITTRQNLDGHIVAIDSDKDPTEIHVKYSSIIGGLHNYITPRVKIEISCLSMHEPAMDREINSYISQSMPEVDEAKVRFKTVLPSRTMLEKIFLLNEEYTKDKPRVMRMSRHLYDLEKLMDTEFGVMAISDYNLYKAIIEHRRHYYALKYFDYDRHSPSTITIVPPSNIIKEWEEDYKNMVRSFIYGPSLSFPELINRIEELETRIRKIRL